MYLKKVQLQIDVDHLNGVLKVLEMDTHAASSITMMELIKKCQEFMTEHSMD
jgi:hypothetical protein